jgi:hypothetical protein
MAVGINLHVFYFLSCFWRNWRVQSYYAVFSAPPSGFFEALEDVGVMRLCVQELSPWQSGSLVSKEQGYLFGYFGGIHRALWALPVVVSRILVWTRSKLTSGNNGKANCNAEELEE